MILNLVLAHGGAEQTCLRHLTAWSRWADRTIFATPADHPLFNPGLWQFTHGASARYDAATNERTREALRFALQLTWDVLVFCEYDAILWAWPHGGFDSHAVTASRFENADPKFKGRFYLHSPIIFGSRGVLAATVSAMDKLPLDAEFGFGDRYFGLAVERAGLPVVNGHDKGWSYSQNHIEGRTALEAAKARQRGAIMMHGIKDKAVFEMIDRVKPKTGLTLPAIRQK